MPDASIAFPRTRLPAAAISDALPAGRIRGEAVAVPAWDEDALTLACRAGRLLGDDLGNVERVVLALGQPVDDPHIALEHLNIESRDMITFTGPNAGTDAMQLAGDGALVLAGSAPRPAPGGDQSLGAVGAALIGRYEGQEPPPDLVAKVGRPDPIARVVGAAAAAKEAAVSDPWPDADLTWAQAQARRHQLDVVPPWQQAAQGAHVSETEWTADGAARSRLRIGTHPDSDRPAYPPTGRDGETVEDVPMEGTVLARTRIAAAGAPGEFADQARAAGPYEVVIVEHDSGARIIGQVCADRQMPDIGDRVVAELRLLFRQMGAWRYSLKWRLAAP